MIVTPLENRPVLEPCTLPELNYQVDPYIGCEPYCYVLPQAETDWKKEVGIHADMVERLKLEISHLFKENTENYLRQLDYTQLSRWESILDITVDEKRKTVQIPFSQRNYRVSPFGVVDGQRKRPDYGTCVILLKYLLMCPLQVPNGKDWISYRDFADSGQSQNAGLANYAAVKISKRYAGDIDRLKAAVSTLGGRSPETDYPYDLSAVITALPPIPILFLYNDADAHFPAQASILYERRADRFLDAECRAMIDWYLLEHLKAAERLLVPV